MVLGKQNGQTQPDISYSGNCDLHVLMLLLYLLDKRLYRTRSSRPGI